MIQLVLCGCQTRQVIVAQEVLDGVFKAINLGCSLRFPCSIVIDEFLSEIVRDALNAAFYALVTCYLTGLHKAFDLVLLALGT
jgi:hypothetical protein